MVGDVAITASRSRDFSAAHSVDRRRPGDRSRFAFQYTGNKYAYAGYLGGGGSDRGLGIAVDGEGNAYVTGLVSTLYGGDDAYLAKVDPTGTVLIYLFTFGGGGFDAGFDVAVDASGGTRT